MSRYLIKTRWIYASGRAHWDLERDDFFRDHGNCTRVYWPTLEAAEHAWERNYITPDAGLGLEPEFLELPDEKGATTP